MKAATAHDKRCDSSHLLSGRTTLILASICLSGLLLSGILPLGMTSVVHPLIPIFSLSHLAVLGTALALSLFSFSRMAGLSRWPAALSWLGLGAAGAAVIVLGSTPIIDPEALALHLAVPKWWIQNGSIGPYLWYEGSLFPALLGLAWLEFINNDLTILIPAYLFIYLLLLGALTARFVEDRTHRHESACLAFIVAVSVPICVRFASIPAPYVPLGLFAAAALFGCVGWLEAPRRRLPCLLAGAALGLCAGCAIEGSAVTAAALPALYIAARWSGIGRFRAIRGIALIGCTAFVVYSPWAIRNGLWISNPFFPFAGDLLGSSALLPQDSRRFDAAQQLLQMSAQARSIAALPFDALFTARDGAPARLDGTLTPLFIAAIVPAWTFRRHGWVVFFSLFITAYLLLLSFAGRVELKLFLPLLLPLVSLTLIGMGQLSRRFKRRYERGVFTTLLVAHLLCSAVYVVERGRRLDLAAWLSGRLDRTAYLAEFIPNFPMIEFVNRAVPADDYVYALFAGNAFFYFSPRIVTGGPDRIGHLRSWIESAVQARLPGQELAHRGITTLVMDENAAEKAIADSLGEAKAALWREFVQSHLHEIHRAGSVGLFTVRTALQSPDATVGNPKKGS